MNKADKQASLQVIELSIHKSVCSCVLFVQNRFRFVRKEKEIKSNQWTQIDRSKKANSCNCHYATLLSKNLSTCQHTTATCLPIDLGCLSWTNITTYYLEIQYLFYCKSQRIVFNSFSFYFFASDTMLLLLTTMKGKRLKKWRADSLTALTMQNQRTRTSSCNAQRISIISP